MDLIEPPADPNDWTDDQWITWLKATDELVDESGQSMSWNIGSRIVNSAPGQVLGQAMLGMAQAIYGKTEEVTIVVEGVGEPNDEATFLVELNSVNPAESLVVFRRKNGHE